MGMGRFLIGCIVLFSVFTSSQWLNMPMSYNYEYEYPTEMRYSAASFGYKDNVMTYKYPEMSYKTDTANATGFLNGGFPGYGNRFGYGQFPVNPNLLPMSYNYEYQYPTEISYSAPSFAYKDNVMTYKYPELNYKTDTASATGFFNGGFQGFGNLFGYGGYGHSGYRRYGRYQLGY